MTAFTDLQAQIAQARATHAGAASRLALTREQLKNVQRQIASLLRITAQSEQLASLQRQAQALSAQVATQQAQVGALRMSGTQLLGRLTGLADPTQQVVELRDTIPILLFPVRIETRFHDGRARSPQLWIRIYPDDCQIDSFEALLTDSEIQNATQFWIAMWRAGGIESQQRGAWTALVKGSGSGRAAYVISQFAPTNPAAQPTKAKAQDVVLVIAPQITVTPAERIAAIAYWTAIWVADADSAQTQAALTALQSAVGAARATQIIAQFAPEPNGWDPPTPYTRSQVHVLVAVLQLPALPTTKAGSWTQAPKAAAMPDRFVALLFNGGAQVKQAIGNPVPDGLAVAPDPSLPASQQIAVNNDDLVLNDDLRWTADFDQAVSVGMGIKIDLTPAEAQRGFDRLLIVGLRLSSDEKDCKMQLETLIAHQYATKTSYSLVPQGSPTNNTGSGTTSFSWVDDPDTSFDTVVLKQDAYVETDDPLQRSDGQWLAEALGIDDGLIKTIPRAGGRDQGEARAMNAALWNGTLGYMLEEMCTTLFAKADVAGTRQFFTGFVSGRGPLPAVRVGNQPYGILPALAFSRYRSEFTQPTTGALPAYDYLQRLHTLLSKLDADWKTMSTQVSHVGQPGNAEATLLDVVGLNSGSVTYYQRYAESFEQLYNKLIADKGPLRGVDLANWYKQRTLDLLNALGANPSAKPPILDKFFYGQFTPLTGPVVDDAPLSETTPIRAYTPDKKNYIEWLASSSLDVIRRQDFGGKAEPTALLYLMLRHSIMLAQWDAGIRLLEAHALADVNARVEPAFIHVQAASNAGQSKFQPLYQAQPAITGNATTTLAEYVLLPSVLQSAPETEDLRAMLTALNLLSKAPTARLERLFAEHVDCCTYRVDAWKTGIAATRLAQLRARGDGKTAPTGIYLGAFGWLEDLRPKTAQLTPVRLEGDVGKTFQRSGDAPIEYDPTNAGYIHAPSLNQAAAGAILKNAYRTHATPANPDVMAVNLSSERVRNAMTLLEGVRNGQTMPALLGYRFERGLHDDHGLAEVDKFIYPLRQAFPLVANQLKSTQTDGTVDITLLEASNVIDGVALVNRLRSGSATYPFGLPSGTGAGQVPPATAAEAAAINATAHQLSDLYDAVADLVLAESVYQVVQGNFDRAAATTSAFSKGTRPPETQVVNTPRAGLALTHRVALHLDPTVDPSVSPSSVPMTPRAGAEAPLNAWLAERIPPPEDVVVRVTYSTPVLGAPKTVTLSQADLQLQPLDLLYLVNLDLDQAMSELDDRITQAIRYGADAHPDVAITINYTQAIAGKVTLFELAALVRSLRAVILKSRALGPKDLVMPLESTTDQQVWDDAELATRIKFATQALATQRDALQALVTDTSDLDTYAQKVTTALLQTTLFGIPQTGIGGIHGDIRAIYDAVASTLQAFATRWQQKSTQYTVLMAQYPALTTDDARFALLRQAEGLIASSTTAQPPSTPGAYKTIVDGEKTKFDTVLSQFQALLTFGGNKLVDFATAAGAMAAPAAQHDATPFDISSQQTAITALRATVVSRVTSVAADLTQRVSDATAGVTAVATVKSSGDRVQRLLAVAKRVLGDEAQLLPRFVLSASDGAELDNAWHGSAALLIDLEANGRRFPVDDWLYGLARVRDKLGAWENVSVLSEAFGASTAALTPLQLPFVANDRWTALEFDTAAATPNNRLLYTAHFARPFDPSGDQCGLLIDEWPELVPRTDATTGVTFHFDRPNSQPPQTMLLALPSVRTGNWSWDDLVATLNETFDGAKARGVDPDMIDGSKYAQFLPATLTAVTLYFITIATNLALNNRIYDRIGS
jgi:hypothetical protein